MNQEVSDEWPLPSAEPLAALHAEIVAAQAARTTLKRFDFGIALRSS